tara:strand:+ start:1285 stop:3729 length:2445 start_codon:yes stop_codon:yes gene_type:complete
MFLILSFLVIILIFWFSALIAEITMDSKSESLLDPGVRVGLGFIFTCSYFAGAWTILSMQQAWVFGVTFISIFIFGKYGFCWTQKIPSLAGSLLVKYYRAFTCFLAGTIVFFGPLILSGNFGPFSEGGGDITIYADSAKLLTDKEMTAIGQEKPSFSEIIQNLMAILNLTYNDRYQKFNQTLGVFNKKYGDRKNPPAAEHQINRIIGGYVFPPIYYSLFAQYFFLEKSSNYHIYYGIQAFFYSCTLIGVFSFFSQFNRKIAILSTTMVAASHGLISVHYNLYALQVMAIATSSLFLAALLSVRLFSWGGFRVFAPGLALVLSFYIHFLLVILPLLFIAWCTQNFGELKNNLISSSKNQQLLSKYIQGISLFLIAFFLILSILAGIDITLLFIKKLMPSLSGIKGIPRLGTSIPAFSDMWFSFLFGTLSQQHYQPYAVEHPFILKAVKINMISGCMALLIGLLLMITAARSKASYFHGKKNFILITYVVFLLTVILQMTLATSTLYAQAKGAQNILILLFSMLVLPLGIFNHFKKDENILLHRFKSILSGLLIVFFTTLLIPRTVYAAKIAFAKDRASILEGSYFSEAKRIRALDPNAYVLFEPRKSSDLYLGIQPFFGLNFISTRHLVNNIIPKETKSIFGKPILASDLISPLNVPHLWLLQAEKEELSLFLGIQKFTWKAKRLTHQKKPKILLFADQYEKNFRKQLLENFTTKRAFSYLRNGAAMLYLPAKSSGKLVVTLAPINNKNYASLLEKEISLRAKNHEFGKGVIIKKVGKHIILKYDLLPLKKPSLLTIARFSSEFWLNVQLNEKDL